MHHEKKEYHWLVLVLIAVAGALLFVLFMPRILSVLPKNMVYNRAEAIQAGYKYLSTYDLNPGGFHQDASLQVRRDLIQYIESHYTPSERDSVLRRLPAYTWQIRWTKPENYETTPGLGSKSPPPAFKEFILQFDAYGKAVAFWAEVVRESLTVNLSDSAALILANFTVHKVLGDEASRYTLTKISSNSLDSHAEHTFIYSRLDPICGLQQQLNLVINGELISKFAFQYTLPTVSTWKNERAFQIFTFIAFLITISMIYLVQLIRKIRSDSVNFHYALMPALAASLLTVLMIILTPNQRDIYTLVVSTALSGFLTGLAMLFAVAVGESSARTITGDKLLNFDALLRGQFRHRALAGSLLHGLSYGIGLAGLIALVIAAASLSSTVSVAEWCAEVHRDTGSIPFLSSLMGILTEVLWFQFALVLAMVSILVKWLPRSSWAVLIFALMTGLGLHSSTMLPNEPLTANILVCTLSALVFAYIYISHDFIAVLTAHFTFATLFSASRLVTLGHPTFWYSGLLLLLPLIALALFAAWAWPVFMSREQLRNFLPKQAVKMVENERLKRELEIARRVQMSFLPKQTPQYAGVEISCSCLPASEVGGDYYDFFDMGPDRLGFAIGDVSGKGVSAAFYMTLTKGFLRSLSRTAWSPVQILIEMNKLFYENVDRGHFISLIFGILDLNAKSITFARAGHDPILHYSPAEDRLERLLPPGIALGLEPGEVFNAIIKEQTIQIRPGDLFVLYTDGYSEAMNQYANEFSEERLAQAVKRHASLPTEEILAKIKTQISHFVGHSPQHDDMTMLIMRIVQVQ